MTLWSWSRSNSRPMLRSRTQSLDRRPHRRRSHANSTGNLTDRYATNELQPKNFAHLAHGRSLCWHPLPPLDSQRSGPESASTGTRPPGEIIPEWWATSSRNGGRDHLGMRGRHHPGIMGAFTRNQQGCFYCCARLPIFDHSYISKKRWPVRESLLCDALCSFFEIC